MEDSVNNLATAALNGNREAWHELYSTLTPSILALLRSRIGDMDAEEIVLLTWEKVFLKQHTYDPSRSFRTWVLAIAMNAYRDRIRKSNTVQFNVGEFFWYNENRPQAGGDDDLLDHLKSLEVCLDSLESLERKIIRFRFWEGLTHQEIAESIGFRTSQIRSKCHRTVQKLAKCMGF